MDSAASAGRGGPPVDDLALRAPRFARTFAHRRPTAPLDSSPASPPTCPQPLGQPPRFALPVAHTVHRPCFGLRGRGPMKESGAPHFTRNRPSLPGHRLHRRERIRLGGRRGVPPARDPREAHRDPRLVARAPPDPVDSDLEDLHRLDLSHRFNLLLRMGGAVIDRVSPTLGCWRGPGFITF